MKQVCFGMVIAALLVSAPRLTLAFLIGDGIAVDQQVEIVILTVTGIGSGLVLTIGNAVLAHALAATAHRRSALWWLEAGAWVLFLVGAVILVAPTLVAGLQHSALAAVLNTPTSAWLWSITAVIIVELLVGAAMAAAILANEAALPHTPSSAQPAFWARLGDALITKLADTTTSVRPGERPSERSSERKSERSSSFVIPPRITTNGSNPSRLNGASPSRQDQKEQALAAMVDIYRQNPTASFSEVGQQIGRSKATISNYLSELKKQQRVVVNDQGVQILG